MSRSNQDLGGLPDQCCSLKAVWVKEIKHECCSLFCVNLGLSTEHFMSHSAGLEI